MLGESAAFDQGMDVEVADDIDEDVRPWSLSSGRALDLGADELSFTPTEDINLPLVAKRY